MPFLLDTNLVSEAIKPMPNPKVVSWLDSQPGTSTYLSVLTLGEIEQGIARAPQAARADRLRQWLDTDLIPQFAGRIIVVDAEIMRTWGRITAHALALGRPVSYMDLLLAATAITRGLTLATRNTKNIAALPVLTVNPWETS